MQSDSGCSRCGAGSNRVAGRVTLLFRLSRVRAACADSAARACDRSPDSIWNWRALRSKMARQTDQERDEQLKVADKFTSANLALLLSEYDCSPDSPARSSGSSFRRPKAEGG